MKIIIIVNDNKKLFKKCWNLNVHFKSLFYRVYIYFCYSERVRDHTHTLYYQFTVTQVKFKELYLETHLPIAAQKKKKKRESAHVVLDGCAALAPKLWRSFLLSAFKSCTSLACPWTHLFAFCQSANKPMSVFFHSILL